MDISNTKITRVASANVGDDVAVAIPGVQLSQEGSILAEGALWTEWRTRGELIAVLFAPLRATRISCRDVSPSDLFM